MRQRRHPPRRGFVLIALLVIIGATLLVATGLVYAATSEAARTTIDTRRAQSRAIAWSGVQVVMNRLDTQRRAILAGEMPELDAEYEIYERDGRVGVVQLLPIGPGGEWLVSEAGKLDLNRVDAAGLEATGLVDLAQANAIIAARDRQPGGRFTSIAQLLGVDDVTAETVYGSVEDFAGGGDDVDVTFGRGGGGAASMDGIARGLADVVTVFAHGPALQRSGDLCIDLNTEWSDELGARLDERFGEGSGRMVKGLLDQGITFESPEAIIGVFQQMNVEPEAWADILDGLSTDGDGVHVGRLDLNRAPLEALMGLPEMTSELAQRIVDTRDAVTDDARWSIVWPILEEVLEPAWYAEHASWLTTRSWTYRVRVRAGERLVSSVNSDAALPGDFGADDDDALIAPMTFDVVIDLTEPTARLAYFRDLSVLAPALRFAALDEPIDDDAAWDEDEPAEVETDDDWMIPMDDDEFNFALPATRGDLATESDLADAEDLDDPEEDDAPAARPSGSTGGAASGGTGRRSPMGRHRVGS